MTRHTVSDERPPYNTDSRLTDYLVRMFRACKVGLDNLVRWTTSHVAIDPPLYENDPHEQYWHVIKDSAMAHIFYQDFGTGKPVADGGIITNYDVDVYTAYHCTTDLAAGTITLPVTTQGLYNISFGISLKGSNNATYFFTVYKNGVATALALPIVLSGNIDSGYNGFAGTAVLDSSDVLDIRCTGTGAVIAQAYMSINRYLNLGEFEAGVTDFMPLPSIDTGWGQAPP